MNNFDPAKPCRTKSGLPARFLGRLDRPAFSLAFAVGEPGNETVWLTNYNGEPLQCGDTILNIPTKHTRERWANYYPNEAMDQYFKSREQANRRQLPGRIACKKITDQFEEGEGL